MLRKSLLLVCAVLGLAVAATGLVRALDGTVSPWQSSGAPTLQKSLELTPNTLPSTLNFDCTGEMVSMYLSSTQQSDCLIPSALGQVGANGIIFNGTGQSIPVVPAQPFYGLQGVPGQSMLITYTTGPVIGSYLHFYTSIRDKMSKLPQYVNGRWQYTITGNPDFSLRDATGKLVVGNTNAMAFSPNGSWMVIDLPNQGFVRVNLATFEILPFASSMQPPGDYSDQRAQLSISNDGSQVVIKPNNFNYSKVYNLASCNGSSSLPVPAATDRCAARDYWDIISQQIPGFRALYQPRFVNNSQISFTAIYNYAPGNFKDATYTLTAPGQSVSGIEYLGMGDSYASGEGAFAYVDGTDTSNNDCHLSTKNYAAILTQQYFPSGHSVACSGAVTDDIINITNDYKGQVNDKIKKKDRNNESIESVMANYAPGFLAQTEFVDQYKPDAITLSIGGNDIGFKNILEQCVSPSVAHGTCYPSYEDRAELLQQVISVFDRLVTTYKTVYKPGKRVYVTGYPLILASGGSCGLNVHFNASEIQLATDLTNTLNNTVKAAADKAGVRYVDITNAFVGHRLCEASPSNVAVNGLTAGNDTGVGSLKIIGNESYHPNALGHQLLAEAIRAQTNNLQLAMPGSNASSQAPTATSLDSENLPKTGRSTNVVVSDDGLAPDQVTAGQTVNLTPNSTTALQASSTYRISLRSATSTDIGSAATDAAGQLTATALVPAGTPPGYYGVDIYGPNLLGQPVDISDAIYVATSEGDSNGDGIADVKQTCLLVPASGQDVDRDGIDDACDGFIGDPPPQQLTHLSSQVTLTENSITISRSGTATP